MYGAIFLYIDPVFQYDLAPVAANSRTGTDIAILPDDHIAGNRRQRMYKAGGVNYGYMSLEGIDHLKRFKVSRVKSLSTKRPLMAARSANRSSQCSVPAQKTCFISFMASGLYPHNLVAIS